MRSTFVILLTLIIMLATACCGCSLDDSKCSCATGKKGETVWCEKCDVGYVGSQKTTCKTCVLGTKGSPACATCPKKGTPACDCGKGYPNEIVWCDKCSSGFIKGKRTSCKGCIDAALAAGKCEKCAK